MDWIVYGSKRAFWTSINVQLKASTELQHGLTPTYAICLKLAELTFPLVSYSDEELRQRSPIEARCRDLARHLGDGPF